MAVAVAGLRVPDEHFRTRLALSRPACWWQAAPGQGLACRPASLQAAMHRRTLRRSFMAAMALALKLSLGAFMPPRMSVMGLQQGDRMEST